jgi:hypothetical protein
MQAPDVIAPAANKTEGRARRVRRVRLDHPFRFRGHDKRAPPNVRRTSFDYPFPWRDLLVRSAE